jgi:hypothetical protein
MVHPAGPKRRKGGAYGKRWLATEQMLVERPVRKATEQEYHAGAHDAELALQVPALDGVSHL